MEQKMSRRPYVQEVSRTTWFFKRPRYMRYMAREVTCIFIGIYTIILLVGLARLSEGQAQYEGFLAALRQPLSIVFHVFALAFSLYNSFTWFNVAPKALPIQVGEVFMPDSVVAGGHYVVWVLLSLFILFWAGVI
ncbi:MAG TPA: fumarate reductase subunit C [Polaromonas sp.]|uniref:fumarate reductase subunit C n=1 Tax=Polaromonas sp. UBA4122 TaxID=1947074 RepID=UPI000ED4351D|nr:fumarate reductase subunit C [Polaromonas sp. UBA4122]HAL40746.1 fumarate reductase subunit C [Polaromonas sp.]